MGMQFMDGCLQEQAFGDLCWFLWPIPLSQAGVLVPYNWTDPNPKYYLLFINVDLRTPSLILSHLIGNDEQGEEGDGLSSIDLFFDPI